jgi:hypothetical protein
MTIVIKKPNIKITGVTKGAVDEKAVQDKIDKLPRTGGVIWV